MSLALADPAPTFTRGGKDTELRIRVLAPGLGDGAGTYLRDFTLVPADAQPIAEIEYPNREPGQPAVRERVVLGQRCCGDVFHGPVRVPDNAGLGVARVMLSFDAWKDEKIVPATVGVPLIDTPKP
jgi:hypothetical protein